MLPWALNAVYLGATLLAIPWVVWRAWSGGRPVAAPWRRFTGRIGVLARETDRRRIWLHGVSVGEVQLLAALTAELRRQAEAAGQSLDCVVSSSTTTGLAVATTRFGAASVFPCPLDFTWAVRATLDRVQPDLIVLGELELWPNLLDAARRRRIPVVVANARMSERSAAGYARLGPLARRMLRMLTLVIARSDADAARFTALGAERVVVTGSMKFDGIRGDREAADVVRLRQAAGFKADDIVFLAGSTQAPEERLAAEAYLSLRDRHPALRLVIVPRHVERAAEIGGILDGLGIPWRRRSELATSGTAATGRVLLVDTTGELGWWWGTAAIAFVGGSLDGVRGGQNMLEPAAYAAAVSFGPHTRNFRDEVARLLEAEAAVVVRDGAALTAFVNRCLDEPTWRQELGRRSRDVVVTHRGATAATARLVLERLAAETVASGGPSAR